jgi:mannose-6-phosphate isomerase-like protein (cupin superfamily)
MSQQRIYPWAEYLQPADGEPTRSVVMQSEHAVVIAWVVKPGQRITPHVHPAGQDTWTIVAGSGDYIHDMSGSTLPVKAGDVAVARAGEVHGVHNTGAVPLVFVSVVAPVEAGFHLA